MNSTSGKLIILVGPKGAGKSHIGGVLEKNGQATFIPVETIWLSYRADCDQAGTCMNPAEGLNRVRAEVDRCMQSGGNWTIESIGIGGAFVQAIQDMHSAYGTLTVKVEAAQDTCLSRVQSRATTRQLPVNKNDIARWYPLSMNTVLPCDAVLVNESLQEEEIVEFFNGLLNTSDE